MILTVTEKIFSTKYKIIVGKISRNTRTLKVISLSIHKTFVKIFNKRMYTILLFHSIVIN